MRFLGGFFLSIFFIATFIFFHFLKTSTGTNQQVQFNIDESYYLENPVSKNKIKSVPNPNKNAYFGDLHIHTSNSFDAYAFGTLSTPDLAYKYAQGESISHPTGYDIQLRRPLDFYAVTDHGFFLGLLPSAADTSSPFSKYEYTKSLHNLNDSISNNLFELFKRSNLFRKFARDTYDGLSDGTINRNLIDDIQESVWKETIKAADDAYKPGVFTTFAGYEYTSVEDLYDNYLHRMLYLKILKIFQIQFFLD